MSADLRKICWSLILLVNISPLMAQTTQWKLMWKANTESDLYQYHIYRDLSSAPTLLIGSVAHPDTVYVDDQLQKGVLYYYRLTALDFSLNQSDYSEEILAAIPKISNLPSSLQLPADTTTYLSLNDYVNDPDDPDAQLSWSFEGATLLQVNINTATQVASVKTPANWSGQETLLFKCTDSDSFFDQATLKITSPSTPIPKAPAFSAIPDVSMNEDAAKQIDLYPYVQDTDSPKDSLRFTTPVSAYLQLTINKTVLTITPDANWNGQRIITVYVTDETGLSDTTTIKVTVNSVADRPQFLTILQQKIDEDGNKQINLADYVQDVDSPKSTLIFSSIDSPPLQLSLVNALLTITPPANWYGDRAVTIFVTDETGLKDTTQFLVKVVASADAPLFSAFPSQEFPEDHSKQINLAQYVVDNDSPFDSLTFKAAATPPLQITINLASMTVTPPANWFGSRTIALYVTDETNLSDTVQIPVKVKSVNDAPIIINLPAVTIPQDSSAQITLTPYATDVDHAAQSLTWQFSNYFHILLEYQKTTQTLKIISPANWQGFEYVRATVRDDSNATDADTLIVRVTAVAKSPQIQSFPDVHFDEDDSKTVALNNLVSDDDTPDQNLFWSARANVAVHVDIDPILNIATFSAEQDWFGMEKIWMIVTDPTQLKDSILVNVFVASVNDAPQFGRLPNLNLSVEKSRNLNLASFTDDVDNSAGELIWTYAGNQNAQVSITAGGAANFSINSLWNGQESITLYVQDPYAGRDTSSILVYSQDLTKTPTIVGINKLQMDEDGQETIDLSQHVVDPDHTASQMVWQVADTQHIRVEIDPLTQIMTLTPQPDWFGTEKVSLQVKDPDNNFDYDTLEVQVNPVNDPPQLLPVANIILYGSTIHLLNLLDYIVEPDGLNDLFSIELIGNNTGFIGSQLDVSNYRIIFFTPEGYTGSNTYLLRVTDHSNLKAEIIFSVQVYSDNLTSKINVHHFGALNNVQLKWQTLNKSKDYIEYGLTTAYGNQTLSDLDFMYDHESLIEELEENQSYHFRIVSQDISGKFNYTQDSTFNTGSASASINVFPIPYRAAEHEVGGGIYFTNLPEEVELIIFNLLGEPVFKKGELGRIFRWSATNNAGHPISSGLYLYVVEKKSGQKITSGKLIIVR